jgi:signal transduction histidine kinase
MPDAKYASLKTPFPFRQHPIQPPSATNATHQILDQKIKGLLNDIEQFLKKQMYTAVYPLIRNFVRFASRKRELQKRIQLELEILSFQQQQVLERLQEMEKMQEQVRELLALVKALSERKTEMEMGREDFESLARRLDLLSGLFERKYVDILSCLILTNCYREQYSA